MTIELISVNLMQHKIVHMKSSGASETMIEKKTGMIEALAYIERYLEESGLEVFNTQVTNMGHFFYLKSR